MDALLLLSPGGGAASSQKPPPLELLLLLFTAELQGELETRLEDPGWVCLGLFWGVDKAGLEVFDGGVPTVAALLAQDKLELALPQTEAYKEHFFSMNMDIFYTRV